MLKTVYMQRKILSFYYLLSTDILSRIKGKKWKCKQCGLLNKFISNIIENVHFMRYWKENYSLKEKAIVPGRAIIYCKAYSLVNMAICWKIRWDLCFMTHHVHSCSRASPEHIAPSQWSIPLLSAHLCHFSSWPHLPLPLLLGIKGHRDLTSWLSVVCSICFLFVCFQSLCSSNQATLYANKTILYTAKDFLFTCGCEKCLNV